MQAPGSKKLIDKKAEDAINVFDDVTRPCQALADMDPVLAHALRAIVAPVIRKRKAGFEGLFRIIVAQQISVLSAQAIWKRCRNEVTPISARHVAAMEEEQLRALGLTGQKAKYVSLIAKSISTRNFSFAPLKAMSDKEALNHLMTLKGVGPWSAGIYLLFCEGRIDIWPPGDIALEHSYGHAAGLAKKPNSQMLNEKSELWKPYRGLAAHILWTYYAHIRGRVPF